MSETQRTLVEDILSAVLTLPPEMGYQLLGVAQGMEIGSAMAERRADEQTSA